MYWEQYFANNSSEDYNAQKEHYQVFSDSIDPNQQYKRVTFAVMWPNGNTEMTVCEDAYKANILCQAFGMNGSNPSYETPDCGGPCNGGDAQITCNDPIGGLDMNWKVSGGWSCDALDVEQAPAWEMCNGGARSYIRPGRTDSSKVRFNFNNGSGTYSLKCE